MGNSELALDFVRLIEFRCVVYPKKRSVPFLDGLKISSAQLLDDLNIAYDKANRDMRTLGHAVLPD